MRTYWNIRQLGRRARLRLRGDSLKRMLRGSSRNINCWKFSSLRTGHATQPTRGAGKRKKVFVVLRDKIFFPRARWTFFFDFRCELFKRLDAQSIRVVLSLFITRDFEISREKRTSRNRFVRSSAFFFPHAFPLWRLTEWLLGIASSRRNLSNRFWVRGKQLRLWSRCLGIFSGYSYTFQCQCVVKQKECLALEYFSYTYQKLVENP